jgi:hypothetical protein
VSLLVSFHTFPSHQLKALLEAATHPGAGLLPFLDAHGARHAEFEYSGHAFCDLELLLDDEGVSMFGSSLTAEAEQLCTLLATSVELYDFASAREVLGALEPMELSAEKVAAFLQSERGDVEPEGVEALQAAFQQHKEWLHRVKPDSLGVLIIG